MVCEDLQLPKRERLGAILGDAELGKSDSEMMLHKLRHGRLQVGKQDTQVLLGDNA